MYACKVCKGEYRFSLTAERQFDMVDGVRISRSRHSCSLVCYRAHGWKLRRRQKAEMTRKKAEMKLGRATSLVLKVEGYKKDAAEGPYGTCRNENCKRRFVPEIPRKYHGAVKAPEGIVLSEFEYFCSEKCSKWRDGYEHSPGRFVISDDERIYGRQSLKYQEMDESES